MKSIDLKDEGLEILVPSFYKFNIQMIGFEKCNLTDRSCEYVSKLIKASSLYSSLKFLS